MQARRQINREGLELIKRFEGCRLKAYPDPGTGGDPWTIGYGSTGPHVKPGLTITQDQAEELLRSDLRRFEDYVAENCAPATDNQFSALVSFAFNAGNGNLEESTLRKLHLQRKYELAQAQFGKWVFGGGKQLPGLVKRRAAEAALYGKA